MKDTLRMKSLLLGRHCSSAQECEDIDLDKLKIFSALKNKAKTKDQSKPTR